MQQNNVGETAIQVLCKNPALTELEINKCLDLYFKYIYLKVTQSKKIADKVYFLHSSISNNPMETDRWINLCEKVISNKDEKFALLINDKFVPLAFAEPITPQVLEYIFKNNFISSLQHEIIKAALDALCNNVHSIDHVECLNIYFKYVDSWIEQNGSFNNKCNILLSAISKQKHAINLWIQSFKKVMSGQEAENNLEKYQSEGNDTSFLCQACESPYLSPEIFQYIVSYISSYITKDGFYGDQLVAYNALEKRPLHFLCSNPALSDDDLLICVKEYIKSIDICDKQNVKNKKVKKNQTKHYVVKCFSETDNDKKTPFFYLCRENRQPHLNTIRFLLENKYVNVNLTIGGLSPLRLAFDRIIEAILKKEDLASIKKHFILFKMIVKGDNHIEERSSQYIFQTLYKLNKDTYYINYWLQLQVLDVFMLKGITPIKYYNNTLCPHFYMLIKYILISIDTLRNETNYFEKDIHGIKEDIVKTQNIILFLLKNSFDINQRTVDLNKRESTTLNALIVLSSHINKIKRLHELMPNIKDLISLLLKNGANPGLIMQPTNSTSLHIACRIGVPIEIIQLLVNHKNSNYEVKDCTGKTCLDLLKDPSNSESDEEAIHYIEHKIAEKINKKNKPEKKVPSYPDKPILLENKESPKGEQNTNKEDHVTHQLKLLEKILIEKENNQNITEFLSTLPKQDVLLSQIVLEMICCSKQSLQAKWFEILLENDVNISFKLKQSTKQYFFHSLCANPNINDEILELFFNRKDKSFLITQDKNKLTALAYYLNNKAKTAKGLARFLEEIYKLDKNLAQSFLWKSTENEVFTKEYGSCLHYILENWSLKKKIFSNYIKLLGESKEQINLQDKNGKSLLHVLCTSPHLDTAAIKLLIKYDIDLNIQDNQGNTALHYLCIHTKTNLKLIAELMNAKSNLAIENSHNQTALDLLFERSNLDLNQLITEIGIETLLDYAINNQKRERVKEIIQANQDKKSTLNYFKKKEIDPKEYGLMLESELIDLPSQHELHTKKKEQESNTVSLDVLLNQDYFDLEHILKEKGLTPLLDYAVNNKRVELIKEIISLSNDKEAILNYFIKRKTNPQKYDLVLEVENTNLDIPLYYHGSYTATQSYHSSVLYLLQFLKSIEQRSSKNSKEECSIYIHGSSVKPFVRSGYQIENNHKDEINYSDVDILLSQNFKLTQQDIISLEKYAQRYKIPLLVRGATYNIKDEVECLFLTWNGKPIDIINKVAKKDYICDSIGNSVLLEVKHVNLKKNTFSYKMHSIHHNAVDHLKNGIFDCEDEFFADLGNMKRLFKAISEPIEKKHRHFDTMKPSTRVINAVKNRLKITQQNNESLYPLLNFMFKERNPVQSFYFLLQNDMLDIFFPGASILLQKEPDKVKKQVELFLYFYCSRSSLIKFDLTSFLKQLLTPMISVGLTHNLNIINLISSLPVNLYGNKDKKITKLDTNQNKVDHRLIESKWEKMTSVPYSDWSIQWERASKNSFQNELSEEKKSNNEISYNKNISFFSNTQKTTELLLEEVRRIFPSHKNWKINKENHPYLLIDFHSSEAMERLLKNNNISIEVRELLNNPRRALIIKCSDFNILSKIPIMEVDNIKSEPPINYYF